MPELPDVEVFKRRLDATALHQTIGGVEVEDERVLRGCGPAELERRLQGRSLEASRRHGKHLFARLNSGAWLELHFGMTGDLACVEDVEDAPPYTRALFHLEGGHHLAFVDRRKLGHLALLEDLEAYLAELGLGPDARALGPDAFLERARGQRGQVKCWLMDQDKIAGIGNVYSDEILFQAGIHPRTPVKALSDPRLRDLHRTLWRVIDAAVQAAVRPEAMPEGFLLPHREKGALCPRCGTPLQTIGACGRTAYLCPNCQPAP